MNSLLEYLKDNKEIILKGEVNKINAEEYVSKKDKDVNCMNLYVYSYEDNEFISVTMKYGDLMEHNHNMLKGHKAEVFEISLEEIHKFNTLLSIGLSFEEIIFQLFINNKDKEREFITY